MQKLYILLAILFFGASAFAQMDTEHWFAPMGSNYKETGSAAFQAVFLSTSEPNAFDVKIYSAEQLIGTLSIKKGSPAYFEIPRQIIITENDQEKSVKLDKGLHLVADKKYFATLRFSVTNHAEIVTSKGRAALGTEFYIGMPKLYNDPRVKSNYTASVIATENATAITLSGYSPVLKFTNDPTQSPEKTIMLNRGQSYIFEIDNNEAQNSSTDGLIGARIKSDKPISVSSGIFSGRIAEDGIDIFMDQGIPVEKTGKEFIVLGGNGNFPNSKIESALIIATEDDTKVYLNDSSGTPDFTIPGAGGHIFVDSRHYKALGANAQSYALHIRTDKNAYVYQILAGSAESELPSGGMNLVPALSCFLPSKIDELGFVNYLPLDANKVHHDFHNVKLNILAQKDADVVVNGSKDGLLGPYDIPGTTSWQGYTKLAVSGTQTIESRNGKAVTAGVSGGSGPAGFGGYFAGFSSVPAISVAGNCANGRRIQADDFYDKYEWEYSTDLLNWQALPDSQSSIDPGNRAGYYRVTVTKDSCLPPQTSKEFKFLECSKSSEVSMEIGACNSFTIVPKLTDEPSASINRTKISILLQPQGGSLAIDASGGIVFNADNTELDTVTFKYYIESDEAFPKSEEVTVNVKIAQIKASDIHLEQCLNREGKATYDLSAFQGENSGYTSYTYFEDEGFSNEIQNITDYVSAPNRQVFVKITNTFSCDNHLKPAKIFLETPALPVVKSIDVHGTSAATVRLAGGRAPFKIAVRKGDLPQILPEESEYREVQGNVGELALDGFGVYTVYIISADGCMPVTAVFAAIKLPNVITPNGDGQNDSLAIPELRLKTEPEFKIYDRYGTLVFEGTPGNNFTWDGTSSGRPLPTASYWYTITFRDYPAGEASAMNGWILLKNRN